MTTAQPLVPARQGVLSIFQPDAPRPLLTDTRLIARDYRRYQLRIMLWTMVGYSMFYFVRKNLSLAMPVMGKELGIGKSQLGLFLTLHGVLYGVSKLANGMVADRANGRVFLAVGLMLSAACNIAFGLSSSVLLFGLFWLMNGWFQGMGSPPITRLMTHWFPPKQLATKWTIWNTSHSIGAGAVIILCGYLVVHSWRLCFFVPAGLAFATGVAILLTLPDTPASVGLPDVAGTTLADDREPTDDLTDDEQTDLAFSAFVRKHVFGNRYIWILAIANFFVYTIRYAVLDWGPTLLSEAKHIELSEAGWMVAAFEISGVFGMLASGWVTDHLFGGRGARTCVFCAIGCIGSTLALWLGGNTIPSATGILCIAGFFIYGPQALVGISVANLATKRAAATAVGFAGFFAYASTVFSGWGLGLLVQTYGWNIGFKALVVTALITTVLFSLAWPAKPNGYAD